MSIHSRIFLAIYMALLEFARILCEAPKPTIVLTDNKSVTRFFQTKAIPQSLWNACDYVQQFNKTARFAGSVNTAADFLSRLELEATEKIHLKIREDVQTTPIELSTFPRTLQMKNSSSSRKQMVKLKPKNRSYNEKKQSQKNAAEWVLNQEPSYK